MAAVTTSNPADYAYREQTYFSRQLHKALQFNLRLGAYGTAKELPANNGGDTIRFFRKRRANRTGVQAITEGVTPTTLTEVAIGYVDVQLKQRGGLATITDLVIARDIFDTKAEYAKSMGEDAALDFDAVCTRAICSKGGTADASPAMANPIPVGTYGSGGTMYGSNTNFERFAGVANSGVSATDWTSLTGITNSNAKLTRAVHIGAITRLKGVAGAPGVPSINGKYPVLCPPEVIGDMRMDSTWIAAATFNNIKNVQLFPWAEFELDGGVFIEHNTPFMEKSSGGTYGVYDSSAGVAGSIYSVLYLGQEAFCVPKLSGMKAGSDPKAPSMIILDKADKADPLNQKISLGWKAYFQAQLFLTNESSDQPHVVVQRVKSTFA